MSVDSILDNIDAGINHFDQLYPCVNESELKQYYTADEFNMKFPRDNGNDLSILHSNIRSLKKNGDEQSIYLETINKKFDIVCLSETWIAELPVVDDIFSSYSSFHSIRTTRHGGGCAIYIKKKFNASVITDLMVNESFAETVAIKISLPNKTLNLGCCYRPPNSDANLFQNFIESKVSSIASGAGDLVFCGDFNLDLLKINEDSSACDFYQLMNSFSLLPIISKPTRITDSSFSLIDNFLVSNLNNFTSGMFTVDITDHYPIFLVYNNYLRPANDVPDKITNRQ